MSAVYFSFYWDISSLSLTRKMFFTCVSLVKGKDDFSLGTKTEAELPRFFNKKCHPDLQNTRIIFPGENIKNSYSLQYS